MLQACFALKRRLKKLSGKNRCAGCRFSSSLNLAIRSRTSDLVISFQTLRAMQWANRDDRMKAMTSRRHLAMSEGSGKAPAGWCAQPQWSSHFIYRLYAARHLESWKVALVVRRRGSPRLEALDDQDRHGTSTPLPTRPQWSKPHANWTLQAGAHKRLGRCQQIVLCVRFFAAMAASFCSFLNFSARGMALLTISSTYDTPDGRCDF